MTDKKAQTQQHCRIGEENNPANENEGGGVSVFFDAVNVVVIVLGMISFMVNSHT